MDTLSLRDVVTAAQAGEEAAWVELVRRFQDFAVAMAIGYGADWDAARDIAQEAFLLAFTKLDGLRDPAAFAGWFAALVRTACGRRARQPATAAELTGLAEEPAGGDHLLDGLVAAEQALMVRRAVEALPEHERTVVVLHFLADLEFADIARFLGIGESAARKRAHSARQRLKELERMAMESLSEARPSAGIRFRDEVLLFVAVNRGDASTVRAILSRSPGLAETAEAWSWSEALAAGLGTAQHGTPLVRAVETGSLPVVEALLEGGAAVDGRCRCAGAETPLWTAVITGQRPLVERLLAAGADPNLGSFNDSTPMHAAGQRHPELLELLVAAGGDADRRDGSGRSARDWAALTRERAVAARAATAMAATAVDRDELLVTGIRSVDLFAPLARGSRQLWPPAVGVGQLVLPFGIADALGVDLWWLGFERGGHYAGSALEAESRELDIPAHAELVAAGPAAERSRRFMASLEALAQSPGRKLVAMIAADAHRHEITLGLHALSADPRVLSTIVIEPLGDLPLGPGARHCEALEAIPEGYDTMLCFDAALAAAGRFPAVDPLRSQTRLALARRHAETAAAARELLGRGAEDRAAEALRDDLLQRLRLGEPFGSAPGELTPLAQTLARVEKLTADGTL